MSARAWPRTSSESCASISPKWSSRRSYRAASGSPRRPATASPSPSMPLLRAEPTLIRPSPKSWSAVANSKAAKRGMGRGLSAILPESNPGEDVGDLRELRVGLIKPNPKQPRTHFDGHALAGLASSIESSGVIQPLLVRPLHDGSYELIAGERRWGAAPQAGVGEGPAGGGGRGAAA